MTNRTGILLRIGRFLREHRGTLLKALLPILVLAAAVAGMAWMVLSREAPEERSVDVPVPLVRVVDVQLEDLTLLVESQGTVVPRTESVLVPEVAGRVVEVSSSFEPGGFFEEGDLLLRIDPHDYRQALIQSRATVAQAELRLAQERAEAEIARSEWNEVGDGEATALTLREPQVADAEAALAAARAAVDYAERSLERTEIRAPYAGRVRRKQVDVGQYVSPGVQLGTVYAVDYAEVRLPLPDEELAYLDLPLGFRGEAATAKGPLVALRADFAGKTHEWSGRIVRTEGEIDPRSRMVHVVARVRAPYDRGGASDRPPLAVGMYVRAEIQGRRVGGVVKLPRSAVRADGRVLVMAGDDRIAFREIDILRATRDTVFVGSGLEDGERVCVTALAAVTDGMRVRIIEEQAEAGPAERTVS